MLKSSTIIALVFAIGATGIASAFPQQAAAGHNRDVARERAERSAEWQKRQAKLAANSKRAAAQRAEDKAQWRAREERIAESKVRAAKNRADDKSEWRKTAAHRAAEAKRFAARR